MSNHSGERYGRLTVIGQEKSRNRIKQICRCDCGRISLVPLYKLRNGYTKSCGCGKKKYQIVNRRIFQCWCNMKNRCDSADRKDSEYYHNKGIGYCEEWNVYENFQSWALENGYADNLTLDRIDSLLPYCPDNCRWITIAEQQRNRSNCLYFTHDGETKTLAEWARQFGINRSTLHDRIFRFGYSFEEAIQAKGRIKRCYTSKLSF